MVRRTFRNLDVSDFRLIYKTYIRPHLEFCIQAWSPYFIKDIQVLENVQKTATNLVPKLRKYSYPDRLKTIGITSLKERVRGDMIEVYKLLIGKEHIEYEQFFTLAQPHYGMRGHEQKLAKDRSRLDTRKHFFSQRVVNVHSLSAEVVNAGSVNSFKNTTAYVARIWTTLADQLASPSTYKYKYKYKYKTCNLVPVSGNQHRKTKT